MKRRQAPETGLKESLEGWISARRRKRKAAAASHGKTNGKAKPIKINEDIRAAQIARRIMVSYGGESALKDFIKMVERNTPGTKIAKRFGVTRQRANQWKDALGAEVTIYRVRPVLRRFLGNQARV